MAVHVERIPHVASANNKKKHPYSVPRSAFDLPNGEATKWIENMSRAKRTKLSTLTDHQRVEKFPRCYELTRYDEEFETRATSPHHDNDNNDDSDRTHEWPARDRALANDLMSGRDDVETAMWNARALFILRDVRDLIDSADSTPLTFHDITEEGEGFGPDAKRDMGASVEKLQQLFEAGVEPSTEGDWNPGPCVLIELKSRLGNDVKALRDVGALGFNEKNELIKFRNGKGEWLFISERARGPKGKRTKPVVPDPSDISMYTGAVLPRDRNTDELAVTFFAGKVGTRSLNDPSDKSHDPFAAWKADIDGREHANGELADLLSLLGRRLYDALVGAATGKRLDEIEGPRGDKRASAIGRALVQVAIEHTFERRASDRTPRHLLDEGLAMAA